MGTTNYSKLAWIEEVTPGQTPVSPAFQELPINSIGLVESIATEVSEAIRSDRMIDDLVIVDSDVGGDNEYELSFKAYKPLMISLLQCAKNPIGIVAIVGATDIQVVNATNSFDSTTTDFVAANIAVGMWINVDGFSNSANNELHRVTAVTANQVIVDSLISILVDEASGASINIDAETYRNSNAVPESYTFRQSNLVDAVEYIAYYYGQQVSQMTFNFETGAILAGAMMLMGLTAEMTNTPKAGETLVPVADYRIMNSVSNLALIVTGLAAGTVYESFNLTVNNNINPQKGIGTLGAIGLGSFTLEITADMNIYFKDLTAYNAFKNSTGFLSAFQLTDGDGNKIVVTLPNCKFETLESPVPGKDEFFFQTGTVRGLRDPITNCMVQFDFISAS